MGNLILRPRRRQPRVSAERFREWCRPDGTPWVEFFRSPEGYLVRFPGVADFEISSDGKTVAATPVDEVADATIHHLFSSLILPLAQSGSGRFVFHGSAVEVAGGAVAFLGESGTGKSTLATAFAIGGGKFLADDGIVVEQCDGRFFVFPSDASIRLWDDSLQFLRDRLGEIQSSLGPDSKSKVFANEHLVHCDHPCVLLAAFFIGDDHPGRGPSLHKLGPSAALIQWTRHSFLLDIENVSHMSAHLDHVGALSGELPCYRLDYERSYENIAEVLTAVTATVTALPSKE